jgi:WD40 repeat protein
VVESRIYSVEFHPSPNVLLAAAGDKMGNVGLWKIDALNDENDGVSLFRPHKSVVSHLEWTPEGDKLFSFSYDGTVRLMDVEAQAWRQVFAPFQKGDTEQKESCG